MFNAKYSAQGKMHMYRYVSIFVCPCFSNVYRYTMIMVYVNMYLLGGGYIYLLYVHFIIKVTSLWFIVVHCDVYGIRDFHIFWRVYFFLPGYNIISTVQSNEEIQVNRCKTHRGSSFIFDLIFIKNMVNFYSFIQRPSHNTSAGTVKEKDFTKFWNCTLLFGPFSVYFGGLAVNVVLI